ncbi:glycosyltransferase [Krasilnikovia sp. M28-CT-15]|uniref:glycosyltransferase n=1 Tax=Krasilnikovia sp. M28-CT-15 TaxID=3373540 RepID=UPI0038770E92
MGGRRRLGSVAGKGCRVVGPVRRRAGRPHAYYLAIGFPPAAKSCAYRMRETANQLYAAGWDVTVITIRRESWEQEFGLDHTLSDAVHPDVRIVELPLERVELETNIRRYSRYRSVHPVGWNRRSMARSEALFPEPAFGGWRPVLEEALLRLHDRDPADLLVTTCAPYVNLAATVRLWEHARVPYIVDFRDGWSIDVVRGGTKFPADSVEGRWESRALAHAVAVWCVNEPIAQHYRDRYPELADRVEVVRNGYDTDSVPARLRLPDAEAGLTFGYLGSVNFTPEFLGTVLDAWRAARREDPVLARSRLEVRGHIGAGLKREDTPHTELLRAAAPDGVAFGGPVAKARVAETYAGWDVVVLMLVGGRYVTSGKVYEVMASGLPVLSVHEVDHDASSVLDGHPLWTPPVGQDPERLADSFRHAANLALTATAQDRAAARALAARYARPAQLQPAVQRLTAAVRGDAPAGRDRRPAGGGRTGAVHPPAARRPDDADPAPVER